MFAAQTHTDEELHRPPNCCKRVGKDLQQGPAAIWPSLADELIDLKEDYGSDLRTEDVTSPLKLVNFIFERDPSRLFSIA